MNTSNVILLLLGGLLTLRLFTSKRSLGPLPPGPKGLPFIGNLFDFPITYQWLTFANWGEKRGDIMTFNMLGQRFVVLTSAQLKLRVGTSGTNLSHPLPFHCKSTMRSDKAEALLDTIRDGAQDFYQPFASQR